ncbi:MAG: hypothetical protein FWB80_10760, partial [Defluviitaleaceae bacterium]|nr:hypothetical protein [Defluviitaleaceae bacterium]
AERMLGQDRRYAADYMAQLSEKHPSLSREFKECAKLLKSAADCAPQMQKLREENKNITTLIHQAAKQEKAACAVLTDIVNKLYQAAGETWGLPNSQRKHDINLRSLIPAVNHTQGISPVNSEGNYRGKDTQKFWFDGGDLVVTSDYDMECLQTITGFSVPLRIDATVKTCSGDIRLYYLMGEILFNIHGDAEFHDHDIITGEWMAYHDKPPIPPDKFVNIVWIIEKEYMEVHINGELYHRRDNMPYHRILKKSPTVSKIIAPIRISAANQSTVTIKSLSVTKL